jgi:hypothetical protein
MSEDAKWNRLAGGERATARLAADRQALLAHAPADNSNSASGDVVVVEAGVVILHPADQPRGEMLVAAELLVDALAGLMTDGVDPQLWTVGQLAHEVLELDCGQVAPARSRHRAKPSGRTPRGQCGGAQRAHRSTTLSCARPVLTLMLGEQLVLGLDPRAFWSSASFEELAHKQRSGQPVDPDAIYDAGASEQERDAFMSALAELG